MQMIKNTLLIFIVLIYNNFTFSQCDTTDFDKNFKFNKYPVNCDFVLKNCIEIFRNYSYWKVHDFIAFKGGIKEIEAFVFSPDSTIQFETNNTVVKTKIKSITSIDSGSVFLLWSADIEDFGYYEFMLHYFDGYRMVLDVFKEKHKGRKKLVKIGRYLLKKMEN